MRVPTYGGPQLREQALPGAYQSEIDVTRGQRQLAAGLAGVSDALERHEERKAQDEAFAADAKTKREWLDYETKLRQSRRGRDAESFDQEADTWWQERQAALGQELSPRAQRLVSRSLAYARNSALGQAKAYKEQQLNASADATYRSANDNDIDNALTAGTEEAGQNALALMRERRAARGALMGWSPEIREAEERNDSTKLHGALLQKMMRTDPKGAQAYFDKYRAGMDARTQGMIEGQLAQTSAALDASTTADELIKAAGLMDGKAVELDKLEAQARERWKNDPVRQKHSIDEIRQRVSAFNAGERERAAQNTNTIMNAYAQGMPLSKLKALPAWGALPGEQKVQIQEHIDNRNHALWARSIEDRNRAEREMERKAFPAYLEYSDPQNLTQMSRDQVQALLPRLGPELTSHLINKWDGLQKPAAKLEARFDSEDFNHVADTLGLRPYDTSKSEDQKRQLGELKFRTEQLIDQAQQAKKGALTREEKMELMRNEMSRTVVVNPTFGFKREVPVIQLTEQQLADVVVPEEDKKQIAAALEAMYTRTQDKRYKPTPQNMRRLYLESKSRATQLLPQEKE